MSIKRKLLELAAVTAACGIVGVAVDVRYGWWFLAVAPFSAAAAVLLAGRHARAGAR
jgi:hypothetical protein